MNDWAHSDLPATLLRTQQKIERWRQRCRPRARIPEELWRQAVELAGVHGIHRIAKALRLDYYSLKRRVAGANATGATESAACGCGAVGCGESAQQFVEVLGGPMGTGGPASVCGGQCLIEVEDTGGVKLRIHLGAGQRPDLVALARVFREDRS